MSKFTKLEGKLSHRKGVTNPAALAAWIGDKKYGAKKMGEMAAKSREKHRKERDAVLHKRSRH